MLMTVTPIPAPKPGLLDPHAPPPLLPKPGKENLQLQRLLKKAAKKVVLAPPQPKAYRSTLSPVNEASPDLEHCERIPPPKTPETPKPLIIFPPPKTPETPKPLIISLPPRHSIKPVIHHVASPYPKQKSFTFSLSERRSLSEYIRLTPSPTSTSVFSKQVIPHVQPQQSPRAEAVVPNQVPRPTAEYSSSAVSETSAPKTQSNTMPVLCTSVTEAPVQVTHVTEVHTQVSRVQSLRARTPILETDERDMIHNKEKRTPVSVAQPETNHLELPAKCLSSVVSTSGNTATTHTQVKTTTIIVLPSPPSNSASEIPRATTPKADSADGAVCRPLTPNTPIPRPVTPNAPIHGSVIPGSTISSSTTTNDKISNPLTEIKRSLTPKQEVTAMVSKSVVSGTPSKNDKSLDPKMLNLSEHVTSPQPAVAGNESSGNTFPKSEPLPKFTENIKPSRNKLSGWSRLKKHLEVEPEEPQFPLPESAMPKTKEAEEKKVEIVQENTSTNKTLKPKESRATKMWNAVLFQMFKESPKQADVKEETKKDGERPTKKEERVCSFRCRLPLLLFAPRFDARKLKEAASRPLKKITTIFDIGRLHRKATHEEPKDFNRTASGWQLKC